MDGRTGTHGDRVRMITDALHKLTGEPPTVERPHGAGATRISVRVTEQPDETQTLAVLRVLRLGDRFGHSERARWERIWVEVADRPRPGPGPTAPAAPAPRARPQPAQ
ncbi:hypothetical protein, partial [Kitasatospora saccharophila]|uniref:hypothetical protein n=1 Tax=Kitasatospora saccharophila TaxID=407973 RepID=UPI0031E13D2B